MMDAEVARSSAPAAFSDLQPRFFRASSFRSDTGSVGNASARSMGDPFGTPMCSPDGDGPNGGHSAVDFAATVAMAALRGSQASRQSHLPRTASSGSLTRTLSRRGSAGSTGMGAGAVVSMAVRVPLLKPLFFATLPFGDTAEGQAVLSARSRRSSLGSVGVPSASAGGSMAHAVVGAQVGHTPLEPTFSFFSQDQLPDLQSARQQPNTQLSAPFSSLGGGLVDRDAYLPDGQAPLSTLTSGSVAAFDEHHLEEVASPLVVTALTADTGPPLPLGAAASAAPFLAGPPMGSAPPFTSAAFDGPPNSGPGVGGPPPGLMAAAAFAHPSLRNKGKAKGGPSFARYTAAMPPGQAMIGPHAVSRGDTISHPPMGPPMPALQQKMWAPPASTVTDEALHQSAVADRDMEPMVAAMAPEHSKVTDAATTEQQAQIVEAAGSRRGSVASTGRITPASSSSAWSMPSNMPTAGVQPTQRPLPQTAPTSALFKGDSQGTGNAFFNKPAPQPQYQRVKAAATTNTAAVHTLFGASALPVPIPGHLRVASLKEVAAPAHLFSSGPGKDDASHDGTAAQLAALGLNLKPAQRPRLNSHSQPPASNTASLFSHLPGSGPGTDYFSSSGMASFTTAAPGLSTSADAANMFFGSKVGPEAGHVPPPAFPVGDSAELYSHHAPPSDGGTDMNEGVGGQDVDGQYGYSNAGAVNGGSGELAWDQPYAPADVVPSQGLGNGALPPWGPASQANTAFALQGSTRRNSSVDNNLLPWQSASAKGPSPPVSGGLASAQMHWAVPASIGQGTGPLQQTIQHSYSSQPMGFDPSSWSTASKAKPAVTSATGAAMAFGSGFAPADGPAKSPSSGPLPASAMQAGMAGPPPTAPSMPVPFASADVSTTDSGQLRWATGAAAKAGVNKTGTHRPQFAAFQPGPAQLQGDATTAVSPPSSDGTAGQVMGFAPQPAARVGQGKLYFDGSVTPVPPSHHAPAVSAYDLHGTRRARATFAGWNQLAVLQSANDSGLQLTGLYDSSSLTADSPDCHLASFVAQQGGPLVVAGQAIASLDTVRARLDAILQHEVLQVDESQRELVRLDVELLHGVLLLLIERGGSMSAVYHGRTGVQAAAQLLMGQCTENSYTLPMQHSEQLVSPDPSALAAIQEHTLKGEREAAIAIAMDSHQWAHALAIASGIGKDRYASTVQAFTKAMLPEGSPMALVYTALAGDMDYVLSSLGLQQGAQPAAYLPVAESTALLRPSAPYAWRGAVGALLANGVLADKQGLLSIAARLGSVMPTAHASHACRLLAGAQLQPWPPALVAPSFSEVNGAAAMLHSIGQDASDKPSGEQHLAVDLPSLLRSEVYEYACKSGSKASAVPSAQMLKFFIAQALGDAGQWEAAGQYLSSVRAGLKKVLGADAVLQVKAVKHVNRVACVGPFPLAFLLDLHHMEEWMRGAGKGSQQMQAPQLSKDTVLALAKLLTGPAPSPKAPAPSPSLAAMFGAPSSAPSAAVPAAASAEFIPSAVPPASVHTVRTSSMFGGSSRTLAEAQSMPAQEDLALATPARPRAREESAERSQQATPAPAAPASASGGGLFSGIRSIFRGRRGAAPGEADQPTGPRVVKLDQPAEAGKPYFDDKLGRWVFPGETEEDLAPPPPPPVIAAAPAPAAPDGSSVGDGAPANSAAQFSAAARAGGKTNRINRYVAPASIAAPAAPFSSLPAAASASASSAMPAAPPARTVPGDGKPKFAVFAPTPAPAAPEPEPVQEPIKMEHPPPFMPPAPAVHAAAPAPFVPSKPISSGVGWEPTSTGGPRTAIFEPAAAPAPAPAFGADSADDAIAFYGVAWDAPAPSAAPPFGGPQLPGQAEGAPVFTPSAPSGQQGRDAAPQPWQQPTSQFAAPAAPPSAPGPVAAPAAPWASSQGAGAGLGLGSAARPAGDNPDGADWF